MCLSLSHLHLVSPFGLMRIFPRFSRNIAFLVAEKLHFHNVSHKKNQKNNESFQYLSNSIASLLILFFGKTDSSHTVSLPKMANKPIIILRFICSILLASLCLALGDT